MRRLALVVLLCLALAAPGAHAQVELDGSIGPASGLVPGGTLPDGSTATYLIEESYGRRSGPNLFHSFSRFNVPGFSSAVFTGDPSIQRVVGRVTSGAPSEINGAIRNTIEGADLYLLNPRGFLISTTASLDLRGSLYLSSGDGLRFEDNEVYSAIPGTGEVLSAAAPSAWGFTSASAPATIRFNQARNLAVPFGETLGVVGGPVIVSGLSSTTTLSAPGGTIALASRATPGEVPVDVAKLSARDAATMELGSVSIGNNAVLDVSDRSDLAQSRGRIVIRSGALTVDSSALRADSAVDAASDVPDIDLETTRSIALRRPNALLRSPSIEALARGTSRGGGVRLSSESITLTGAAFAATTASGAALAGPLEVDAGSLQLSEISRLETSASASATAGQIAVNARSMELTAGAQISSVNEASTEAPDVVLSVADVLQLGSGASLVMQARADGRGASLRIAAHSLEQGGGARIESVAFGSGAGGDLELEAVTVNLNGEPLGTDPGGVFAGSFGLSDAGDIVIGADDVTVAGGAQVSATAEGAGRGGDIEIDASRSVSFAGSSAAGPSGVFARSGLAPGTIATGAGGSIGIEAPVVVVDDGAEVSVQTFGSGAAGGIHIVAAERVGIAGGATSRSSVNAKAATGAGGSIAIETAELRVDDGGEISASTLDVGDSGDIDVEAQRVYVGGGEPSGAGPAGIFAQSIPTQDTGIAGGAGGDIDIRASSLVEIRNGGVISAKTRGSGAAGTVRIVAPVVNLTGGAEISAQTFASGEAGGIQIIAAEMVGVAGGDTRSVINAQADQGSGGDVVIETAELRVDDGGEISASTLDSGESGDIAITAERVFVGGGATSHAGPARISARSTPTSASGVEGGAGGDISIRAADLVQVGNGGAISAETLGSGAAGAIAIFDARSVRLEQGEITARSEGIGAAGSVTLDGVGQLIVGEGGSITSEAVGEGPGGSISIDANSQVLVMNGGTISALSTGTGDAGSVTIDAGQRFSARNGGQVSTSAVAADGGDISIAASRLIYIQDAKVTTDVRAGTGSGGNITLDPEFVVLNRAELRASATGDGGNITIQTDRFVRDASSVVDASSEFGVDGEIQTTSPTVDLTSELAQLDTTFLDASSKLAAACAARSGERGTFAVRGSVRTSSPDSPLGSPGDEEVAPGCEESKP